MHTSKCIELLPHDWVVERWTYLVKVACSYTEKGCCWWRKPFASVFPCFFSRQVTDGYRLCEVCHLPDSSEVCTLIINCHYCCSTHILMPTCWVTKVSCIKTNTQMSAPILLPHSQNPFYGPSPRWGLCCVPTWSSMCSLVVNSEICTSASCDVFLLLFLFFSFLLFSRLSHLFSFFLFFFCFLFVLRSQGPAADRGYIGWPSEENSW